MRGPKQHRSLLSYNARSAASCYPTVDSQAPSPSIITASPALHTLSDSPVVQQSISTRTNAAASTSSTVPPSTPPVSGWGSSLEESFSEACATFEPRNSPPPPSISPFSALPITSPSYPPPSQQHFDPISLFSYREAEKLEKRSTVPPSLPFTEFDDADSLPSRHGAQTSERAESLPSRLSDDAHAGATTSQHNESFVDDSRHQVEDALVENSHLIIAANSVDRSDLSPNIADLSFSPIDALSTDHQAPPPLPSSAVASSRSRPPRVDQKPPTLSTDPAEKPTPALTFTTETLGLGCDSLSAEQALEVVMKELWMRRYGARDDLEEPEWEEDAPFDREQMDEDAEETDDELFPPVDIALPSRRTLSTIAEFPSSRPTSSPDPFDLASSFEAQVEGGPSFTAATDGSKHPPMPPSLPQTLPSPSPPKRSFDPYAFYLSQDPLASQHSRSYLAGGPKRLIGGRRTGEKSRGIRLFEEEDEEEGANE